MIDIRVRILLALLAAGVSRVGLGQISPVNLTVGLSTQNTTTAISPLIYGVNFAGRAEAIALNLPINRNGGNSTTRYNWQQDSTSSGSDWYFLSHLVTGGAPSASVDAWIADNNATGVQGRTRSMVTVPIIGYVANVGPSGYSWSFSVSKYGAQQATDPYHPDAGNGFHTNGTYVTGNNPADANAAVAIDYQHNWLSHLVTTFGSAQAGGVSHYLLDNEPGLWMSTHRDVFPNGVTMDSLFAKERDAATLVKSVDPSAQVCGPEEWGWLGYLYSGADYDWLAAHGWQGTPPDRASHGGQDCVAYLLRQFALASASAGRRLLDVFSLHYYPQGNYSDTDASQAATDWRSRSTRSLWDPNYADESWIGSNINLIPRMKSWVVANYPGTKLGITEYNWGDDYNMGAAIANADALGIFGRDGVELANRWVCPAAGSPTFNVFQMYRNYDGANSSFGDQSLPIGLPSPDTLSAFGSMETSSRQVKVMLIHKRTSGIAPVNLTVAFPFLQSGNHHAKVYQLTASGGIMHLADSISRQTTFSINLPPQSVTLLVISLR